MKYLIFTVNNVKCCVDTSFVTEILTDLNITKNIPLDKNLIGFVPLRNKIYPVLSIRRFIDSFFNDSFNMFLLIKDSFLIGIDSVEGIKEVDSILDTAIGEFISIDNELIYVIHIPESL